MESRVEIVANTCHNNDARRLNAPREREKKRKEENLCEMMAPIVWVQD